MSMNISSAMPSMPPGMGNMQNERALSTDQKDAIKEVLSNFDLKNLSESDVKSIVSSFQDAKIQPGKSLASELESYGVDARALGDLAGLQPPGSQGVQDSQSLQGLQGIQGTQGQDGNRPPPPPPPKGNESSDSSVNTSNLSLLQSILDQYDNLESLTAEETSILNQQLADAGLLEPGALINTRT